MQAESDQGQPVSSSPEDRSWAAVAHLSALLFVAIHWPGMNALGPLVVWLAHREASPFVEHQARAALNFQIGMGILMLANLPLVFLFVGIFLGWLIAGINVVFIVLAAVSAAKGNAYAYPFTMHLVKPPGAPT